MSLSTKVSQEFSAKVRERGRLYFLGGTVRVKRGDNQHVEATVRGTENYRIKLSWQKNKLFVACSCPYYETEGPCKHIWATLLTAEQKGYLKTAGAQARLRLELDDDVDEYDDELDNEDDELDDEDDEIDDEIDDEDEDEDDELDRELAAGRKLIGAMPPRGAMASAATAAKPKQPTPARAKQTASNWQAALARLNKSMQEQTARRVDAWPAGREIFYVVDVPLTLQHGVLIVEICYRERKANGEWGKIKALRVGHKQIPSLPDAQDRRILSLLVGAREHNAWDTGYYAYNYDQLPSRCRLTPQLQQELLPSMCATNRCRLRRSEQDQELPALAWDQSGTWEFRVAAQFDEAQRGYLFDGVLRRGDEQLSLASPIIMVSGGLIFNYDFNVSRLDDGGAFAWLALLRKDGPLIVPAAQAGALLAQVLKLPQAPPLDLPEELRFDEVALAPQPRLKLKAPAQQSWGKKHLRAELSFAYDGAILDDDELSRGIYQPEQRRLLVRDRTLEGQAAARLKQLGFRLSGYSYNQQPHLELAPNNLPRVVRQLTAENWHVEAEGKLYRQPGGVNVGVKSGIDWFELHGTVEFGEGVTASLPELLAALKRGDNSVRLGDGTFGLLPEEWLKQYGTLAGLGQAEGDHLRFTKSQAGFLDALLAAQPAATFDEGFARLREELRTFEGIQPLDPPATFNGELRPYQREGLGWFDFLRRFHFGGCLADDMGLGKCVSADTLVAVNGTLVSAENLWRRYSGLETFNGEGYWTAPTAELLANSLDEQTGLIKQTQIRRMYRQRVRERLRRITLEDGNGITITRSHKLLTDEGWTNELNVGDYVCVPATSIWSGATEDADLVKFLAWQIAEGYELRTTGRLTVTQKDVTILEELQRCVERISEKYALKINCPKINLRPPRPAALIISSVEYQRFLQARGYAWGKLSREKTIPPFIMQADLDSVRLFLRNYFDAEGSAIESMRSIEISTASAVLIQQLSHLLRRFGIWMRLSAKQKCATNGSRILRTYYMGTIGGNAARKFSQEIGFGIVRKQQLLEHICARKSNTNVEGIPASGLVSRAIAATQLPAAHCGVPRTVYLKGTQQFSRASLQGVVSAFDNILSGESERAYQKLKPSKWTSRTLNAYAKIERPCLQETRNRLQHLLALEVHYCKIKSCAEVEYEGWVYDFEIIDHHNFVANNIICHNTIEVLALLETRRVEREIAPSTSAAMAQETNAVAVNNRMPKGTSKKAEKVAAGKRQDGSLAAMATPPRASLVVVPKSLVFNWQQEAARFTPQLRVLNHTGIERTKGHAHFDDYDLVLTTYGTLRRDAAHLKDARFDYVILDESQAVKNASTESAKAVRLLRGAHRLALSGTPVENHLGELWSLFEFLNPGMLGASSVFQLTTGGASRKLEDETRTVLAEALRPFILRRTKEQVAKDLPSKLEQTIYCDLEPEQRRLYDELRDHYRLALLGRVEREGINKAKIQILEALLRLRQAACHPGLISRQKLSAPGAKIELLLPRLTEVLAEGHKALVFSQFTSLLAIVRARLDAEKVVYEYLDGRTRKRAEKVERFQNDPDCQLFLISLKAGGLGLNLTAAEYVFLLDPWWNPAVEAQAIDRAHRIGQTRNVFAYRLIARDTVEEKVLELQQSKRHLADAIINADNSLIRQLNREDLELLLA